MRSPQTMDCFAIDYEMPESITRQLAESMRGCIVVSGAAYPTAASGKNPVHIKVYKSGTVDWCDISAVNAARNDGSFIFLSATVASNGKYFVSLPCLSCDEKYDVLFDRAGYLDYVITEIPATSAANVRLPRIQMIPGDIASEDAVGVKDGVVDEIDLGVMSRCIQGDTGGISKQLYNTLDLDGSGKVDVMDLTYMLTYKDSHMSVYRYREVAKVIPCGEIHVPFGANRFLLYRIFASAEYILPKTVMVALEGGGTAQMAVAWELSGYDPTLVDVTQKLTGIVIPSRGIVNPHELNASVVVIVDRP